MEAYTSARKATLRDYLRVLFRHKFVIIASFITMMTIVSIGLKFRTPVYESQVKILASAQKRTEPTYYREIISPLGITVTQKEIVKSNPVIERTVKALRLDQRPLDYEKKFSSGIKAALIDYRLEKFKLKLENLPPEEKEALLFRIAVERLKDIITVNTIRGTDVFTITARDFSPVAAAIIANVVSRSYIIFDLEQQYVEVQLKYGEKQSLSIQLQDKIEEMKKTLDGRPLPDIEAIGPASVKIIEQAQIPFEPVKIGGKNLILTVTFFMSIILGVSLAILFESLDQTFKSPQDIETYLNVPFLGSIPKKRLKHKALIEDSKKETPYTKAYQNLSDQIYLLIKDKNIKSLLITDVEGSGEPAVIIANLGIYLANRAGHKALIIDANLRNPSIHKILNIPDNPGLADVLEDKVSFDLAIQNLDSNLAVLTSGKTELNPCTLLDSSMMSDVIKKAKDRYDIVFINCADLRNFTDAVMLSSFTDGTAIVVNEGKIRRQVLKNSISSLEQRKVNFIGVILNNRSFAIPKIIYRLT